MLESELRELFERQATADQLPLPVSISAMCGRGKVRLRRRRAGVIGSPLLAVGVVLGLALGGAVPPARPGAPQAPGGSPRPAGPMAYVLTIPGTVVPVSLATDRLGRPIRAVREIDCAGCGDIVIAPDGRTVYVSGYGRSLSHSSEAFEVRPIDTATRAAGRPILLPSSAGRIVGTIEITPDGRTAYVLDLPPGLAPVNLVTRTALRPIRISNALPEGEMAITPGGKMAYALNGDAVVPVRTATSTALRPIQLGAGYNATSITIAPDGSTAYIASETSPEVIPVDLATNKALKPIVLRDLPGGGASGIAITPDSRTGYVVSAGSSVIPVDLATDTALKPITLPGRQICNTSAMDPDGKMLYLGAWGSHSVIPVSTVTNTALKPIRTPGVPVFITFAPDGKTVYVGNGGTNTVTLIRAATGRASGAINVGGRPAGIVFAP
jgi:YVTN family beta-propeller protein